MRQTFLAWALAVDGKGDLYGGGDFTQTGNGATTLNHVAKWDGTVWSALGPGLNDIVGALALDRKGPFSAVGQTFTLAGGKMSCHIARWVWFNQYLPLSRD